MNEKIETTPAADSPKHSLDELVEIWDKASVSVKIIALDEILGLTADKSGYTLITNNKQLLRLLVSDISNTNSTIAKKSSLTLVNITSKEPGAHVLMQLYSSEPKINIVSTLLTQVCNKDSFVSDQCCMTLSNISRCSSILPQLSEQFDLCTINIHDIVRVFTKTQFNEHGNTLHYLAPFLSNLTQLSCYRRFILAKEECVIQKLLPFTEFKDSNVRRGGIIGTLRNCCFEIEYHEWVLGPSVDILPSLLLPLAGPEEFDDEDNDKLPVDLQYLSEDKKREADPDLRRMLLEAIHQLCATRKGREILRKKNTYIILRELHRWEKQRDVLLACENVIDILIKTEEEIGEDNLRDIPVPEEYLEKFEKMDSEFLKDED